MCSHYEGFSIAVLEAMASGIPVILTRVPGLNDFLMLFKQAVGVDCSAQKISDGILSLLIKSQDERIKIGSQIAQQCQEMFSIKNGVCKYADLYQKI